MALSLQPGNATPSVAQFLWMEVTRQVKVRTGTHALGLFNLPARSEQERTRGSLRMKSIRYGYGYVWSGL